MNVHSSPHPFELGQGMDSVLDGVGGDDVRVVSLQVILARPERELHVGLQLDDGVAAPLSPDDQHLHSVFAVARSHKLHLLRTNKSHGAIQLNRSDHECNLQTAFVPNELEADVVFFCV